MKRQSAKELLAASFRELAEKKAIDKITVREIAENCGYSPATFYRQFRDKYDLIAWDYTRDMAALMARLRSQPPAQLQGYPVLAVRDYRSGLRTTADGSAPMALQGSDVLAYELAGGQTVVIRPSGTEPKIKVYALMKGPDRQAAEEMAQNFADGAAAMLNIQ
jgi:AcrR family transcriptional regulator